MIGFILLVLIIISFLWAVYALHREGKMHHRVSHAKQELHREKILFKK